MWVSPEEAWVQISAYPLGSHQFRNLGKMFQSLPDPHESDRACLERTQEITPESESVWLMADGG